MHGPLNAKIYRFVLFKRDNGCKSGIFMNHLQDDIEVLYG